MTLNAWWSVTAEEVRNTKRNSAVFGWIKLEALSLHATDVKLYQNPTFHM
jgi:hypothetical protein